jgi:hypothetical protein
VGNRKTSHLKNSTGSTLPLIIGLASLVLASTLTITELQSLLLQRSRALSEARFAALFIAKETNGFPPVLNFDYGSAVIGEISDVSSVSVVSSDGKTFTATVCRAWKSPFGIHPELEICDEAKARVFASPV